jgi:hypothetical protein
MNYILVTERFHFRERSTTEIAMYTLLNNILPSLENKNYVGGLFCGLQNHNILLQDGILRDLKNSK